MSAAEGANPLFRAQQLIRLHRDEEAATLLGQAIASDPTNASLRQTMALCLIHLGRHDAALKEVDAAIRLDPTSEWSFRLRSVALLSLGRRRAGGLGFGGRTERRAALAAAREAVRLAPEEPAPYVLLVSAGLANRNVAEALAAADHVVRLEPTSSVAFNTLGVMAQRLGRLDGAEAAFRKALEIDPEDAEALANLGAIAQSVGQRRKANELFEASARADPRQAFGARRATRMSNALLGQAYLTVIMIAAILGLHALGLARRDPWWVLGAIAAAAPIAVAVREWRSARATYRPGLLEFSLSPVGLLVIFALAFLAGLVVAVVTGIREIGTVVAVISCGTATRNLGWLRGARKIRARPPRDDVQALVLVILALCSLGCVVAGVGAAISLPDAPAGDVSGDVLALVGGPLFGLVCGAAAWSGFRARHALAHLKTPVLDGLEAAFRLQHAGARAGA